MRAAYQDQVSYAGGTTCVGDHARAFESCNYEGTNLAIMDRNQSVVMVFSALSDFDSLIQARLNITHELRTGVPGTITSIPAGYKVESFIHVGADGINHAYKKWGDTLLLQHGKQRTPPDASIVLSHLGYSSTAGYFYTTEGNTHSIPPAFFWGGGGEGSLNLLRVKSLMEDGTSFPHPIHGGSST